MEFEKLAIFCFCFSCCSACRDCYVLLPSSVSPVSFRSAASLFVIVIRSVSVSVVVLVSSSLSFVVSLSTILAFSGPRMAPVELERALGFSLLLLKKLLIDV
uniref:Uncharacterized protein n=1 Tax=Cacopsylla melanoneura TaxID=428564 RepID=A0A8D8RB27_9HEMI